MTWCSTEAEAWVACDHDGCSARVTHPITVGCDESSAWMYASEKAVKARWLVPDCNGTGEGLDRCDRHRPDPRDCPRPDVVAHCPTTETP